MAILSIIRRWHYRDHVSLREIAKRLGVSRNTVRRYIRAGTVLPTYPERQSPSKLDGFAASLASEQIHQSKRGRMSGHAGASPPNEAPRWTAKSMMAAIFFTAYSPELPR